MAITVREVVSDHSSGSAATTTIGSGTAVDDVLVAIGFTDFYNIGSGFGPPTGGGWTERVTVDRGSGDSKIRIWTKTVTSGGSASVNLSPINDEEVALGVLVLSGVDTSDPVEDTNGQVLSSTPHVAPSVVAESSSGLLISAAICETFEGGGNYTAPSGMTKVFELDVTAPGDTPVTCAGATQTLSATGATGTRSWTYSGTGDPGAAVNIIIRPFEDAGEEKEATGTLSLAVAADGDTEKEASSTSAFGLALTAPGASEKSTQSAGTLTLDLLAADAAAKAGAADAALALDLDLSGDVEKAAAGTTDVDLDLSVAGESDQGNVSAEISINGDVTKSVSTTATISLTVAAPGAAEKAVSTQSNFVFMGDITGVAEKDGQSVTELSVATGVDGDTIKEARAVGAFNLLTSVHGVSLQTRAIRSVLADMDFAGFSIRAFNKQTQPTPLDMGAMDIGTLGTKDHAFSIGNSSEENEPLTIGI